MFLVDNGPASWRFFDVRVVLTSVIFAHFCHFVHGSWFASLRKSGNPGEILRFTQEKIFAAQR